MSLRLHVFMLKVLLPIYSIVISDEKKTVKERKVIRALKQRGKTSEDMANQE